MMQHCKHTLTYRRYDRKKDELAYEMVKKGIFISDARLWGELFLEGKDKSWNELTIEEKEEIKERPHVVCGNDCPERKKE